MYERRSNHGCPPASASRGTSPPRSDPVRIQSPGRTKPMASTARSLPVFRQTHFADPGGAAAVDCRESLCATDPNSPEGLSMTWVGEEASRARGMPVQPAREMRSAGEVVPNSSRKGCSPPSRSRSNSLHRIQRPSVKDAAWLESPGEEGVPDLLLDGFRHLLLPATTYRPPKTSRRSPEEDRCDSSYSSLTPPSSSDIPGLARDEGENESDASESNYSSSPRMDKPLPPVPVLQRMPECNWRCGSRLTADQFSRGTCDKCNRQFDEETLRHSLLLLPMAETGSSARPTAWIQQKLAEARAGNTGRENSERRPKYGEADHEYQPSGSPYPFHTYTAPNSRDRRCRDSTAGKASKDRKPQSPQTKRAYIEAPRYVPTGSGNLAGRRQMNGRSSKSGSGAAPPAPPSPKRSPHVFTQFCVDPGEGGPPLYPRPLALRRPEPDCQSPLANGDAPGFGRGATPRSCPVESTSATDFVFVVSPNGTMQDQPDRKSSTAWSQQLHSGSSSLGSERSGGLVSSLSSTDDLISAYLGLPDRNGMHQRQGGGETAPSMASRRTSKLSKARAERPPVTSSPERDLPRSTLFQAARTAPREPWPGMPGSRTLGTAGQPHPGHALKAGRLPPIASEPERSRPARAQSPAKSVPPIKFDTRRRRPACDRL